MINNKTNVEWEKAQKKRKNCKLTRVGRAKDNTHDLALLSVNEQTAVEH